MSHVPSVLLVQEEFRGTVYSEATVRRITESCGGAVPWANPRQGITQVPPETEVIFSTWGMPRLDAANLAALPRLRAVFYGAGTVKGFVTAEAYARDILVCGAASANATPVAEFTVAAVVLSLKQAWQTMRATHAQRRRWRSEAAIIGACGARVGVVSLGLIGRKVVQKLNACYEMDVVAYVPFVAPEVAAELGVEMLSLEELFRTSDVVTLHTPMLPSTRGIFGREHFASMKPHATLINTARGGLVREDELCAVLAERPDLCAVLDVTDPEPPRADSPLWDLPNVFITPHIAGSIGNELGRMGEMMLGEFRRWRAGEPLQHQIPLHDLSRIA